MIRWFLRPLGLSLVLLLLGLVSGCAHYEYELVEPADQAQHIGTKQPINVTMEPIHYQAQTVSDRLVLAINNLAQEPIKLLGDDSFAVDPQSQSHPLPTRTIAPGTATTLVLPPVRPTFRRSGPNVGVGMGFRVGSASYGRRGYYAGGFAGDPWYYDEPRYYVLQDDGSMFWDWTGDGTLVRLRLVYQQGDKQFHHDFVFRRVKM
jgi:hypothetical protein